MNTTKRIINVTVTPYEGDDFPEAAKFDEYVSGWLVEHYKDAGPCEVTTTFGSKNEIFVDGEPEADANDLLIACWDTFAEGGYADPCDVIITTESGIDCLWSAPSLEIARSEWDGSGAHNEAIREVRWPRKGEVLKIEKETPEHDYR